MEAGPENLGANDRFCQCESMPDGWMWRKRRERAGAPVAVRALATGEDASTIGHSARHCVALPRPRHMVRFLSPAGYRSMRWKNGGGRTSEIASYPPGAALDAFTWRVSIADVGSDGAFSRFPGIDRTIVLLEGAGMRLTGDGCNDELRTPFAPYSFSGDDAIDCTLLGGTVRDFNAMFRRGEASGTVTVVRGDAAEFALCAFVLAYAATGAHDCAIPGHPLHTLHAGHALLVERSLTSKAEPIAIKPSDSGAVALVVGIDCP